MDRESQLSQMMTDVDLLVRLLGDFMLITERAT